MIYYTLDGSDPRLVDGLLSSNAVRYVAPISLNQTTEVRARVLADSVWSALQQAVFRPPQDYGSLVLSEINYHPAGSEGVDGDEFEFLELKNSGATVLDLSGVIFSEGITFRFPTGARLAAGEFTVLVRNPAQFAARYPGVAIGGTYAGKLSNSGETVTLADAAGHIVRSVTYEVTGTWPSSADGLGYSLVPVVTDHNGPANDDGQSWLPSKNRGGSPGGDDPNSSPSGFRLIIESLVPTPQGIVIGFEAAANRAYGIQTRESLESGTWTRLTDVPAIAQARRETVLDIRPYEQRYYRIVSP